MEKIYRVKLNSQGMPNFSTAVEVADRPQGEWIEQEDDYKIWLEEMLIESNPDWVCDGMYDMDFTHEWCGKHCGEDSNYVTPKCLHLYYHHIARADRKTEPTISKMEQVDEPQTEREGE